MDPKPIDKFVRDQLSVWPEAAANFRALKAVETKDMMVGGLKVRIQHNPARIRSSAAKVDKASLTARKCFLCPENRPDVQQSLPFEGRKGRKYEILVNPYPIFPDHLVIARNTHTPQSIWNRLVDMSDIARHHPGFTVFYNGPKCGASAPDHMHFQACPRGIMPLEVEIDTLLSTKSEDPQLRFLTSVQDAKLYHYEGFTRGVFALSARTSKSLAKLFYRLLDCLPQREDETEPMFNLLLWYNNRPSAKVAGISHGRFGEYRAVLLARDKHRSHHYFSDGTDHLTMSPGCADMAGLFIVPQAEDFQKLNSAMLEEMLSEVSVSQDVEKNIIWKLTRCQSQIRVGIMSEKEIEFEIISDGAGKQKVKWEAGRISYNGTLYDELLFDACTMSSMFAEPTFILYGVTIGVDFHWEQKMTQKFAGSLKFIVEGDKVVAVNIIGIEDYLLSVISSEMKATAPLDFLKAHSVISRSWVMNQILHHSQNLHNEDRNVHGSCSGEGCEAGVCPDPFCDKTENGVRTIVKWFDREDHTLFDVCADDHCQRYQGLSQAIGENVRKAVDETWGQVLMYDGKICDARFSKCCGGVMETFDTCWGDEKHPYLQSLPDPFCNTDDGEILANVLNDYDLDTKDFYRWKVEYTRKQLSELVARRSGTDIGLIKSLQPLGRGASGRIFRLLIEGDKISLNVSKELMIRRFLSESHLKSSAFEIEITKANVPEEDIIVLDGSGWGHGVGLCQIGAAVMSSEGYDYMAILHHYYPGSQVSRYITSET